MHRMTKVATQFNLSLTIFREGNKFVAYTPALDLSTSGDTFDQVKKRFGEAVTIFFEETFKRGTLDQALKELGWQKIHAKWTPPQVVACTSETVQVPAYA